jgi:hypothetical protein
MEKLPHYNFSRTVSLSKTGLSLEEAMDLSRDRQIEEVLGICNIINISKGFYIFKHIHSKSEKQASYGVHILPPNINIGQPMGKERTAE